LCALATAAPTTWEDLASKSYSYTDYNTEFGKVGSTERQAIFETNLAKILAHNQEPQWTYKMGVNQFTDYTVAEFKAYYAGYSKDHAVADNLGDVPDVCGGPKEANASFTDFDVQELKALPDSVDWRTHTPKVVTAVKNQGGCGSCWAFSTVETIESNIAMNTGKLLELSPQQIVSCAKNTAKCGGTGGCQGSTQWLGFNYTLGAGITDEKDYPYNARTGTCAPRKIKKVGGIKGCVRLPANNYTLLMNAVANIGPISISAAAEPWQMYESGVYNGNCGTDVDHAIQAVGYGTDGGKNYWLVRNSWGGSWGEKGYIRIGRTSSDTPKCATDKTPSDGTGCAGGPKTMEVCGLCGMLSDSSYVTGGFTA
jgi:cathepsin L